MQAAPTSNAPARWAPSACATSGAVLGVSSSWVIVATITRSSSAGVDAGAPESLRAGPRRVVGSRSSAPARGRSRMPVRDMIHSSVTPSRSASSAVVSRPVGSSVATDMIVAARGAASSPSQRSPRQRLLGRPTSSIDELHVAQRPLRERH